MPAKLRPALFVVAVFVVGFAGVFVGNMLRTRVNVGRPAMVTTPVPTSLLEAGGELPAVDLVDEDGNGVSSLDLAPGGGVVLFLDLECPPCTDMARRWQRARDEGILDGAALFAVTYHTPGVISEYKAEHGFGFPVYRDTSMTFRKQYRVDRFPLEVVVGRSGRIRSTSYDSESPIDPVLLHEQLDD